MAQTIKNLLAMQEMRVRTLDWEEPLEKEMATHSIILAWRIPWTEEPDGLQFMGLQRIRHDWVTFTFKESKITKGEGKSWCNCKRSLSRSHSGLGNWDGPLELFQTETEGLGLFGCMLSPERIILLGKVASFSWGQFQKSNWVVNHEQPTPLS